MIRYLLDTCICIDLIRGKSRGTLSRLRQCRIGEVGISSITLAELQYGAAKSSDPARNAIAMSEFCASLETPSFDHQAAFVYGLMRAALERSGRPIGSLDMLIAAHALALGAILVTCNEGEFRRVDGLSVENWSL